MLDITTFVERGAGYGSKARDIALHMLPPNVKYGIPLTPVHGVDPKIFDASTYNNEAIPSIVGFHSNHGAKFLGYKEGYKEQDTKHGKNVVFTRYVRDDGLWRGVRQPTEITNLAYQMLNV